ncbi:MAG: hypothetical protein ACOC1U_04950 [Spirochaetota bacterium]
MRWRWRERGTELGLATLVDRKGQTRLILELHYLPGTVTGFWLDPEWVPFAVVRRALPS